MARTFPTAGQSPIDGYSSDLTRPLLYLESLGTTDDIDVMYVKATLTSGDNAEGISGYWSRVSP